MYDLEEELNFTAAQLNESFGDASTMSVSDALCDVAYSVDLLEGKEASLEIDVLIEGVFVLGSLGFIREDDRKPLSFRDFEVSAGTYPPSLTFTHKHSARSYTVSAPSTAEPTLGIDIVTSRYSVTSSSQVRLSN